jgi:hypothetical protein
MADHATLLFFWDYDTQWGADRSRSPGGPKSWGHLEFENTVRLLELHAEYQIPACFAVVGSAALPGERPYHDPKQIQQIHAAGHEVASHSHRHEWLPALNSRALRETLVSSKDALEQCIGAPVVTFVPPYNQPLDCPQRWSFSLSERRAVPRGRTDLGRLCKLLQKCGYRFCRVSYRTLLRRLRDKLAGERIDGPVQPEQIADVTCIRLNTPCGFSEPTQQALRRALSRGGCLVVYGHPHSLRSGNTQDEKHLVPFFELTRELRDSGKVTICQPRSLLGTP